MSKNTYYGVNYPSWFDINNYETLNNLPVNKLLNELDYRVAFLKECLDIDDIPNLEGMHDELQLFVPPCPEWLGIRAGNVITQEKADLPQKLTCGCLPSYGGVEPIVENGLDIYEQQLNTCTSCETPTLDIDDGVTIGNIALTLDIESYDDRELISQLKILLPLYRQQLQLPEPTPEATKRQTSQKYFSDILKYNIIPYLDLQLWALHCFTDEQPESYNEQLKTGQSPTSRQRVTSLFSQLNIPFNIPTFTYTELNQLLFDGEKSEDFMRGTFAQRANSYCVNKEKIHNAKTILNEDLELSERKSNLIN